MHHRQRGVAFVVATFLLVGVSSASANKLSISSRTYRVVWSSLAFASEAGTVSCPVTLEGSYHSATMTKVNGSLIGYITRATISSAACTGGRASARAETLPWHVRYGGFEGTLPNITGVTDNVTSGNFRIESGGITCEAAISPGTVWKIVKKVVVVGFYLYEAYKAWRESTIPLSGEFFCGISGNISIEGEGRPTILGATTKIAVRLI